MKTIISIEKRQNRAIPAQFQMNDNRFSEDLVEYFINEFTTEGDLVFDPFAGLGTTLLVAEEMNRIPYGIEYNQDRYRYVKSQLGANDNLIHGDALLLNKYDIPKFDLCLTSPPYMQQQETTNPFTNHKDRSTYSEYLQNLRSIFKLIERKMKPQAKIAIEVSNLKNEEGMVTLLAWDVAYYLRSFLTFSGEIVLHWKTPRKENSTNGIYGYGYDHSYCLIYAKKIKSK